MAMIKTSKETKNDENNVKAEMKVKSDGVESISEDGKPKPDPQPLAKLDSAKEARIRRWEKKMRFQPKSITVKQEENHDYYKKLVDSNENLEIPRALSVLQHASQYTQEVNAMMAAIKQHSSNKTALQCLPRHMRRRAASHNNKRLPVRLRELAKQQHLATGGDGKGAKNVKRKKRRRHPDLQKEYAKRTGKQGWLETHLWHAKRFHMSESTDPHFSNWGHRVPLRPTDKSYRAGYRGVAKHCVIQDISYMRCIEVEGSKKNLQKFLMCFLHDEENLATMQNAADSQKEMKLDLYDKDQTPAMCIGPASVMWIPNRPVPSSAFWIWVHPIILEQLLMLMTRLASTLSIDVRDISSSLNRISLVGPKSSVTLLSVLRNYNINIETVKENDAESVKTFVNRHDEEIEKQYSIFVSVMKGCHQHYYHGTKAATESICFDGAMFPLVVDDPRLTLPLQKTMPSFKATKESIGVAETSTEDMKNLSASPLWHSSLRKEISSSRLPDHVVSTRRNESKFETEIDKKKWLTNLSTPVPVMVVRRAGYKNAESSKLNLSVDSSTDEEESSNRTVRSVHGGPPDHFSSGWDLILPSNWSMPFWIPLVYHRGRAVGLKQQLHTSLECKIPHFPRDYPDTDAGKMFWKAEEQKNHKDYYKKPPAKRPNLSVLGSPFPFAPYWPYLFKENDSLLKNNEIEKKKVKSNPCEKVLVGEGVLVSSNIEVERTSSRNNSNSKTLKRPRDDPESDSNVPCKVPKKSDDSFSKDAFRVLRNKKKLRILQQFISSKENDSIKPLTQFASAEEETLVCVKISALNKGIPFPLSSIYLPMSEDVADLHKSFHDLKGKGLSECAGPIEPKHWDPYRKERKLATQEAKKNRKRRKEEKVEVVRKQPLHFQVLPSRNIVGFVTSGDFLFSFAAGGGIGFISLKGLVSLVQLRENNSWLTSFLKDNAQSSGLLALMRNANCPQYRFVTLDLVL